MLRENAFLYFEDVSVVLGGEIDTLSEAIRRWKNVGMSSSTRSDI